MKKLFNEEDPLQKPMWTKIILRDTSSNSLEGVIEVLPLNLKTLQGNPKNLHSKQYFLIAIAKEILISSGVVSYLCRDL